MRNKHVISKTIIVERTDLFSVLCMYFLFMHIFSDSKHIKETRNVNFIFPSVTIIGIETNFDSNVPINLSMQYKLCVTYRRILQDIYFSSNEPHFLFYLLNLKVFILLFVKARRENKKCLNQKPRKITDTFDRLKVEWCTCMNFRISCCNHRPGYGISIYSSIAYYQSHGCMILI